MARRSGARGRDGAALAVALIVLWVSATTGVATQPGKGQVRVRPWPCLLVVKPTLQAVVEDGWQRSPTFRRQCEDLAAFNAVVLLEWGSTDSQSRAISRMQLHDGVVVAHLTIPPVPEALELVAHEVQHVLEKARGLDFELEANRPESGVWRAFGGYETQAAIDAGRQVWREVSEARKGGTRPLPGSVPRASRAYPSRPSTNAGAPAVIRLRRADRPPFGSRGSSSMNMLCAPE